MRDVRARGSDQGLSWSRRRGSDARSSLGVSLADASLADSDAPSDVWHRERSAQLVESLRSAAPAVREEELLRLAARPVTPAVIKFACDQWPGTDEAQDATWVATAALARRELAVGREAGIAVAMTDLSSELLDWIDAHIGGWEEQSFSPAVHRRIDELLDAGRRGRERGRRQRGGPPRGRRAGLWGLLAAAPSRRSLLPSSARYDPRSSPQGCCLTRRSPCWPTAMADCLPATTFTRPAIWCSS